MTFRNSYNRGLYTQMRDHQDYPRNSNWLSSIVMVLVGAALSAGGLYLSGNFPL